VGPRFSGKVREEPQRREGKRGGEKLRNQDFCIRVTRTNRADEEEREPQSPAKRSSITKHLSGILHPLEWGDSPEFPILSALT